MKKSIELRFDEQANNQQEKQETQEYLLYFQDICSEDGKLEDKIALHRAILDITHSTFLSPIEVYQQVLSITNKEAQKVYDYHQYLHVRAEPEKSHASFQQQQEQIEYETDFSGGFATLITKEKYPIPLLSETYPTLLKTIQKLEHPNIEHQELLHMLNEVHTALEHSKQKQLIEDSTLLFRERTEELNTLPEKADKVIISLISSLQSLSDRYGFIYLKQSDTPNEYGIYTRNDVELTFSEMEWKTKIIKDYKERLADTKEQEVMSNVDGRIDSISFALSSYESKYVTRHFEAILSIMEAKKDDPSFTARCIYTKELSVNNFKKFLKYHKISVPPPKIEFIKAGDIITNRENKEANDSDNISIWIRDGGLLLKHHNKKVILEPKIFRRPGTAKIYDNLSPTIADDIRQSKVSFEGGNIRSTKSYVFIGSDSIKNTISDIPHISYIEKQSDQIFNSTIQQFEKELGKKVIVVGAEKNKDGSYKNTEKEQPVFHIDMMITPLDDTRIMVGQDPQMPELNQVAEQLEKEGFEILRCPYKHIMQGHATPITYNNALIETYEEAGKTIKKVYLPQYYVGSKEEPFYKYYVWEKEINLHTLNTQAKEAYEQAGLTVVPIAIPIDLLESQGALDCMTFETRK